MSTIHFKQTTASTPEQFIAGLTDFGPGRSKLFGFSADECLTTTGPIPNRVVLTTTDSDVRGSGSGHTYTFTRQPNGTTDVDVVVVREGKNFKGRVLGMLLGTLAKGALGRVFGRTVKAIGKQR
jgi:hypothetical protein